MLPANEKFNLARPFLARPRGRIRYATARDHIFLRTAHYWQLSWNHSGRIGQAYALFQRIELSGILQQHPAGKSYIVVIDLTKQELMQEMNIWLDMISSQDTMKKNQEDLQLD